MALPFKAVISDLDGTLLNEHHAIGNFTSQTMQKLLEKGIDIILATGRHYIDVEYLKKKAGFDAIMVTSNGASIHDINGEVIHNNTIPKNIANEIVNFPFNQQDICFNFYQHDKWFIDRDMPALQAYQQGSPFQYRIMQNDHSDYNDALKFFYFSEKTEPLIKLEHQLKTHFGDQLYIAFSIPNCLEVMNQNVNKGSAITKVLQQKQKNYSLSDCIVFGDGLNDMEMLRLAGQACVMENADQRLKSELPNKIQIGSNKNESVANYLHHIFKLD